MSACKLNITVVGAGIGGLVAAASLRYAGHDVTIYEKSTLSHEVGQGITIAPNGGRILRNLGLDFHRARMIPYLGRNVVNAETLEVTQEAIRLDALERACGVAMYTAYRVDLHAALVDLVREAGVEIVTDEGVEEFDAGTGTVVFASGRKISADLVVAADGVKSTAATHILGPECPDLDSSGTIVYRFTLSEDQIRSDPVTAPLLDAGHGMCTFNVDPTHDRWLVRYWCRDDGLQNFALYSLRTHDDAAHQEHALRFKTDRESLLREMEGFNPALRRLAEMTTDVLPLWRCTTREPLKTLQSGRMVVIGDAAHPVKPHIGLGAVSAIEDGGVLGALFSDLPASGDLNDHISTRLRLFDKLRVGRVAAYKFWSDTPFFRNAVDEQRHNLEKWLSTEDMKKTATPREMMMWYMGFDVVQEATDAVKGLSQTNGHA